MSMPPRDLTTAASTAAENKRLDEVEAKKVEALLTGEEKTKFKDLLTREKAAIDALVYRLLRDSSLLKTVNFRYVSANVVAAAIVKLRTRFKNAQKNRTAGEYPVGYEEYVDKPIKYWSKEPGSIGALFRSSSKNSNLSDINEKFMDELRKDIDTIGAEVAISSAPVKKSTPPAMSEAQSKVHQLAIEKRMKEALMVSDIGELSTAKVHAAAEQALREFYALKTYNNPQQKIDMPLWEMITELPYAVKPGFEEMLLSDLLQIHRNSEPLSTKSMRWLGNNRGAILTILAVIGITAAVVLSHGALLPLVVAGAAHAVGAVPALYAVFAPGLPIMGMVTAGFFGAGWLTLMFTQHERQKFRNNLAVACLVTSFAIPVITFAIIAAPVLVPVVAAAFIGYMAVRSIAKAAYNAGPGIRYNALYYLFANREQKLVEKQAWLLRGTNMEYEGFKYGPTNKADLVVRAPAPPSTPPPSAFVPLKRAHSNSNSNISGAVTKAPPPSPPPRTAPPPPPQGSKAKANHKQE